jgi:hypothetical protein
VKHLLAIACAVLRDQRRGPSTILVDGPIIIQAGSSIRYLVSMIAERLIEKAGSNLKRHLRWLKINGCGNPD